MKPIDRKRELVAQAAIHRQRVAAARQTLAAGLQPSTLVKGVGGLALAGLALLRHRKKEHAPTGVAALLPLATPLALRGLSFLGKKLKPPRQTMRTLLIVGALGALGAFAAKKAMAPNRARPEAAGQDGKNRRR